ncbi:hypothetical protein DFH08DRAFT_818730 [Mycena albidolilacea]|uniref:Uncharacterized protein n=1 Tax=Mycena albidolilacea TaxID=1033008 RepID=A0AAD7EGE6_9AGAR|nr:hypothetical protein DFH08DRAFT_818730 [Mycena albidolilacea]
MISPASDHLGEMWGSIDDRSEYASKTEKDREQNQRHRDAVAIESSSDGVVGLVKTVLANDEVKAIGNAIIEGVPAIMSALETLTEIHQLLKGRPSIGITMRKRTALFGKIRDVMFILLELKGFRKDDTRSTPEGKPVLSRLASICKDMKKDIEECYNGRSLSWQGKAVDRNQVASRCRGPVGPADKGRPGFDETAAVAALRKEYREDIQGSMRFAMELDDLGKDLDHKIQQQGDRLIKYFRGGPHRRIKDKCFGSGKSRAGKEVRNFDPWCLHYAITLSSASKLPRERTISSVPEEDDDGDDPETDITVPLPDDWIPEYLQALDPDYSGFATISEINAFTHARPEDWRHSSFPRWISYWTIGWQIYANKYCLEIEELFGQMILPNDQTAIKMPGKTRYLNAYIEGCWEQVTALTFCIEPCDSDPWLVEKFAGIGYIANEENLAKMHLCLKQDIDPRELRDDIDTVDWVIIAPQRTAARGTPKAEPTSTVALNSSFTSGSSRRSAFRRQNFCGRLNPCSIQTFQSGDIDVRQNIIHVRHHPHSLIGNTTIIGTVNAANRPAGSLAPDSQCSYIDEGTWFQYRGTYLPERAVIAGTLDCPTASGSFLFKKELWSFAIKAVVQDLRRNKPSFLHLEYSKLLHTFSYEQMTELCKLYAWYTRAGNLQPAVFPIVMTNTIPDDWCTSAPKPNNIASEMHRGDPSGISSSSKTFRRSNDEPDDPSSTVADDTPPSETDSTNSTADIQKFTWVLHPVVLFVGERAPESDEDAPVNSTPAELTTPLESQWEQLEKRIQEHVDKHMDKVESRLTSRLVNIEELLKVIVGREASRLPYYNMTPRRRVNPESITLSVYERLHSIILDPPALALGSSFNP